MVEQDNTVRRDLRFLWHSNAHYTGSGYAVFTRDLLTRLKPDGWTFAEVANHGVESYPAEIDGIKVYPRMADPHGSDAILHHAIDFKAQAVITMLDVWILQSQFLAELAKKKIAWIPYVPIDQEPVPPGVLQNLSYAHKIITFSKFGQQALEKQGFASSLILEGIDPDIFKPADKSEARKALGIPEGRFLFGMIGANKENPPRKGYQEALDAFKLFLTTHPEALMFFHCQQTAPGMGFPIIEYANYLGIAGSVLYLEQYRASFGSNSWDVAKEINCFDVLLHPSQTEGFGLLSVEAQSCGVPVIVNRCTAMPELVVENKTGWISEVGKGWWRNLGGYVYPADVNSLRDKMEIAFNELQDTKKSAKISKDCRDNVVQNYNINTLVKTKWIPFFESLQEELLPKEQNR